MCGPLGAFLDAFAGRPPAGLPWGPPQDRDHRRSLPALRIFGDLPLRPGEILRGEGEARGLLFGRGEAADGHLHTAPRTTPQCQATKPFGITICLRYVPHWPASASSSNKGPTSPVTGTLMPGGFKTISAFRPIYVDRAPSAFRM